MSAANAAGALAAAEIPNFSNCADLWIVKRLSNRRRQFLANGERRSGWRAQAPPVRYVQAGHARLRRRRRIGIARQARGPGSRQYMNPLGPAGHLLQPGRYAGEIDLHLVGKQGAHRLRIALVWHVLHPHAGQAREQQPRQVGRRAHSRRGIEERARPFPGQRDEGLHILDLHGAACIHDIRRFNDLGHRRQRLDRPFDQDRYTNWLIA